MNHIFAIFLGLLDLMQTEGHKFTFTIEEMKKNGWQIDDKKVAPYIWKIDKVANASFKCSAIKSILKKIQMSTNHQGHREKIVLLTEFSIVVRMLQKINY